MHLQYCFRERFFLFFALLLYDHSFPDGILFVTIHNNLISFKKEQKSSRSTLCVGSVASCCFVFYLAWTAGLSGWRQLLLGQLLLGNLVVVLVPIVPDFLGRYQHNLRRRNRVVTRQRAQVQLRRQDAYVVLDAAAAAQRATVLGRGQPEDITGTLVRRDADVVGGRDRCPR